MLNVSPCSNQRQQSALMPARELILLSSTCSPLRVTSLPSTLASHAWQHPHTSSTGNPQSKNCDLHEVFLTQWKTSSGCNLMFGNVKFDQKLAQFKLSQEQLSIYSNIMSKTPVLQDVTFYHWMLISGAPHLDSMPNYLKPIQTCITD